jgi:ATP-dependent RNA helicase DOB1
LLTSSTELQELETEKANMTITDEPTVKEYYQLRQQLDTHTKDMRAVITHPSYCLQFLQHGRIVKIKYKDSDFGWGAVVNVTPRKANKGEVIAPQDSYVVDVLLPIASNSKFSPQAGDGLPPGIRPMPSGDKGKNEVVPVLLSCIDSIGHLRVFLPNELKSVDQRNNVRKALDEVQKRFPDGIAILDPIENMHITDEAFKKLLRVSFITMYVVCTLLTCVENRSP